MSADQPSELQSAEQSYADADGRQRHALAHHPPEEHSWISAERQPDPELMLSSTQR